MKAPNTRRCVVCGTPFKPKIKSSVACSDPCRAKRNRQLTKLWFTKHDMTDYWRVYKADYRKRKAS